MTLDDVMRLADDYANAWHANQTSRVVAAYDDGSARKALHAAIEQYAAEQRSEVEAEARQLSAMVQVLDAKLAETEQLGSVCPCRITTPCSDA